MTPPTPLLKRSYNKAAALIIVLAFVVLLTGLALAYFSRTTTDRQLAHSSFHDTDADLLARSALDIVVGDFRQEILNGSTATPLPPSSTTIYIPTAPANIVPRRNLPTPIPNLIRISASGDPGITAPAVGSRASAVNSANNPSANGRFINTTRWNKHCLITPSAAIGVNINNPSPVPSFTPPDWVIVTRAGPTPFPSWDSTLADASANNNNYAVGRYAYAVYDEGGLLDINVSGHPAPATPVPVYTDEIKRKGDPSMADLTAFLVAAPISSTPINQIAGFRNYATMQPANISGTLGTFTFDRGAIINFCNYYLGGNIIATPTPTPGGEIGTSRDFGVVNNVVASDGRTDQAFVTRAELINFFNSLPSSVISATQSLNGLQYLGTFSREQNKPTLPLTPGWTGTRVVLPQRFSLSNLSSVVSPVPPGWDVNIRTYFGLQFASAAPPGPGLCDGQVRWKYVGQGTNTIPLSAIPAFPSDLTTSSPDFFQYINYALFGVTSADSTDMPSTLGIGAALIDVYDADALLTGIYYVPTAGIPTPTPTPIATPTPTPCDTPPTPAPCLVYGPEQSGTTLLYVPPSCMVASTPDPFTGTLPPINTPFRNVGEFGRAYSLLNAATGRNNSTTPKFLIDFKDPYNSVTNPDPALLDFFTYNSAPVRSGIVSLNTRQPLVLAALLKFTHCGDCPSSPLSLGGLTSNAQGAANVIVNTTATNPALSRADIARLTNAVVAANISPFVGLSVTQETKDTIPRALSEVTQTRTWGLLIDVVAQTGHYKPNATTLGDFIVEGEKRYWLHIAIDRFDGTVVGQQLEEVLE